MIKKTTIESATLSFARISSIISTSKELGKEDVYTEFIKKILEHLSNKSNICDFGLLWNAYTEKNLSNILMDLTHPNNPIVIHADSGGLQEITLGLKYTDKDKEEIYTRQALYSTHAMSFDKMPIIVKEDRSSVMDLSNRYFTRELIKESALESGYNVLKQCEIFSKTPNKKSKILVIIQGHTFEDYKEYTKHLFSVFDNLDENTKRLYYKQIAGLSIGLSGMGNYFNLIDVITRIPKELEMIPEELRSEIHFLGLGGITRVAPIFALQDNFFGRNIHFTFDSTSRTSSATYGKYTKIIEKNKDFKIKTLKTGRTYNKNVEEHLQDIYNEFNSKFKILKDRNIKNLYTFKEELSSYREDGCRLHKEMIKQGITNNKAKYIRLGGTLIADFLHWASELVKFYKILEIYSNRNFSIISNKKLRQGIEFLSNINTYEEYMLTKNREYLKLLLEPIKMSEVNVVEKVEDVYKKNNNIIVEEW